MPFETGRPPQTRDLRHTPTREELLATAQAREAERATQAAALNEDLGLPGEPEFVKLLHQMTDAEHLGDAVRQTVTLGVLIDALAEVDSFLPMEFAGAGLAGTRPLELTSWRGAYADLAITYAAVGECPDVHHQDAQPVAVQVSEVGDVLLALRAAVGCTFEGYKGGDCTMSVATPVWVSQRGHADRVAITGLSADSGLVLLHLQDLDS